MSAGKGIVHAESVGAELVKTGGAYEMIQLWVNLPKHLKMSEPNYQPFDATEIPCYQGHQKDIKLNVISGSYLTPDEDVTISTNSITFTNADWNVLLYQLGGDSKINNGALKGRQLAYFNFDGTDLDLMAKSNSRLLLVSAPPINEPLAQYGPFVMNRPEELQQAIEDYQSGEMGFL